MNVYAYLNHGRWIVDCPKCGKRGATLAEANPSVAYYSAVDGEFICPKCHPGMVVQAGRNTNGSIKFNKVTQGIERKKAEADGEIYRVVFPANRKEIEKAVAKRSIENQNWKPGETIEFLDLENIKNGVK